MHTFRSKTEVLTVSPSSLLLSVAILFGIGLTLLLSRGQSGLTMVLVGSDTSAVLQATVGQDLRETINTTLSNQFLGRAVVFGAWAFVGMATLIIITAVQTAIYNYKRAEAEMTFVNQDKALFKHDLEQKLLERLGLSIIWGIYTVIFFRFVVTFFVAACFVAIQGDTPASGYLGLLLASALLMLGVHVHVVIARLFAGRVRLWGD